MTAENRIYFENSEISLTVSWLVGACMNKKHLKNVGLIRHCEPLHCHSPGAATVARSLRIDVHNDNAWQREPLWPHRMDPIIEPVLISCVVRLCACVACVASRTLLETGLKYLQRIFNDLYRASRLTPYTRTSQQPSAGRIQRPVFGRLPEPNRAWLLVSCLFFTLDQSAFGILITWLLCLHSKPLPVLVGNQKGPPAMVMHINECILSNAHLPLAIVIVMQVMSCEKPGSEWCLEFVFKFRINSRLS